MKSHLITTLGLAALLAGPASPVERPSSVDQALADRRLLVDRPLSGDRSSAIARSLSFAALLRASSPLGIAPAKSLLVHNIFTSVIALRNSGE